MRKGKKEGMNKEWRKGGRREGKEGEGRKGGRDGARQAGIQGEKRD